MRRDEADDYDDSDFLCRQEPKPHHGRSPDRGGQRKRVTVPRAELFAALFFIESIQFETEEEEEEEVEGVDLHIDNSYVVQGIRKMQGGTMPGDETQHGDLWHLLAKVPNTKLQRIRVHKVKAHLSQEEAGRQGFTAAAWKANQAADQLADEAAAKQQFQKHQRDGLQSLDATMGIVWNRLLAVYTWILGRPEAAKVQPPPRPPKAPIRERLQAFAEPSGHKLVFAAGVLCSICRLQSPFKPALDWVGTPCTGPGAPQGHRVRHLHGLFFCCTCGVWGKEGKTTPLGLRRPCGRPTRHGSRVLARLLGDPPKPPYSCKGGKGWPDGTVLAIPTSARKRKHADTVPVMQPTGPAASNVPDESRLARNNVLGEPRLISNPRLLALRARIREKAERGGSVGG